MLIFLAINLIHTGLCSRYSGTLNTILSTTNNPMSACAVSEARVTKRGVYRLKFQRHSDTDTQHSLNKTIDDALAFTQDYVSRVLTIGRSNWNDDAIYFYPGSHHIFGEDIYSCEHLKALLSQYASTGIKLTKSDFGYVRIINPKSGEINSAEESKCKNLLVEKSTGVPGTDALISVSISKSKSDTFTDSYVLGRDECQRPTFGGLTIYPETILRNAKKYGYSEDSIYITRHLRYTILHEIFRFLAFRSGSFNLFSRSLRFDTVGNLLQGSKLRQYKHMLLSDFSNVMAVDPLRSSDGCNPAKISDFVKGTITEEDYRNSLESDKCKYAIVTPKAVKVSREFFDSDEIPGAPLASSLTTHYPYGNYLDHDVFASQEIMTPSIGLRISKFISPITLAIIEDSGWYQISTDGYLFGTNLLDKNRILPALSRRRGLELYRNGAFSDGKIVTTIDNRSAFMLINYGRHVEYSDSVTDVAKGKWPKLFTSVEDIRFFSRRDTEFSLFLHLDCFEKSEVYGYRVAFFANPHTCEFSEETGRIVSDEKEFCVMDYSLICDKWHVWNKY